MNQLLSIVDDGLVIKKLSVQTLEGPVQATDNFSVKGTLSVDKDIKASKNLEVAGTLTVDTLKVKNLVSENDISASASPAKDYTFRARNEAQLQDKGLTFVDENGAKQFVYRQGNRMYSSMNLDLEKNNSYQINSISVLSQTSLGPSVTSSSLKKIGKLNELTVNGPVVFDDWVFFNNNLNRLGINTESPNGTIGIALENAAEFTIDDRDSAVAIGTLTSNDLNILTDNVSRISIKNTGDIHIGSEKFKNARVKINGILEVDQLITSGQDNALLPIIFSTNDISTINGTGFLWKHGSKNRQFTYALNPDRIYTSEIIDLKNGKWYSIDQSMVLSRTTLGNSVTESNLEKLGQLRELNVSGPSHFEDINATSLSTSLVKNDNNFKIVIGNIEEVSIEDTGDITIGHNENTQRQLNLHGHVNVKGTFSINSKQIVYNNDKPASGTWKSGDICFNQEPTIGNYIGWVCVQSGTPGRWAPFGNIINDRT
jgi:hypothetical protein